MTIRMGDSKFADNYQIFAAFSLHHSLMLDGDFSYEYEARADHIMTRVQGLRVLEQIIAGVLLLLFTIRLV